MFGTTCCEFIIVATSFHCANCIVNAKLYQDFELYISWFWCQLKNQEDHGVQKSINFFLLAEISEVPDIKFELDTSEIFVSEDEETLTVCAVSGQLAEEYMPMNVVISTVPDTAEGHSEPSL